MILALALTVFVLAAVVGYLAVSLHAERAALAEACDALREETKAHTSALADSAGQSTSVSLQSVHVRHLERQLAAVKAERDGAHRVIEDLLMPLISDAEEYIEAVGRLVAAVSA